MPEQVESFYFLKELFPGAGAELLRLLQGAAENAFLLRSDFYTIRDWVEMTTDPDPEVLHAILLLMLVALEEGSLCIEVSTPAILRRLIDLVPEADAQRWAERVPHALEQHGFTALMGTSPLEHRPIIRQSLGGQRFLYFQKYLRAELDFQRALNKRLESSIHTSADRWTDIVKEVLKTQPLCVGDHPLQLDQDQLLALGTALIHPFAIISGGPGTGKTSIVLTLLRCLIRSGLAAERIALAAPTGRAAQRLSDALRAGLNRLDRDPKADTPEDRLRGLEATTLHHLLGYRPSRNVFTRHAENPIPADVVIVDEASMVGLVMMSQLMQALDPGTRLILLGDKDQLPSVEAGAILANLVPDGCSNFFYGETGKQLETLFPGLDFPCRESAHPLQGHVVLLQTNHRSQQQIRAVALDMNRQDASVVDRLPTLSWPQDAGAAETGWLQLEQEGGCWLLEQSQGTAQELRGFLQQWAEQAYFRGHRQGVSLGDLVRDMELADRFEEDVEAQGRLHQLFLLLDRYRLLTLVRESAWGCVEINRYLEQYLRPKLDGDARAELFAGAPVLITSNDPARGLHNGDVGITLRHRDGGLRVLFERQDDFVVFPADALPAHELGFALTVHKSQGSEYTHVMVVLPPTGARRLLSKELIYTAITRAKSLAILCSGKEVLRSAIQRRIIRESGLLREGFSLEQKGL